MNNYGLLSFKALEKIKEGFLQVTDGIENLDAHVDLLHLTLKEPVDSRLLATGQEHIDGTLGDIHPLDI